MFICRAFAGTSEVLDRKLFSLSQQMQESFFCWEKVSSNHKDKLILASSNDRKETVKMLVEQEGIDINSKDI